MNQIRIKPKREINSTIVVRFVMFFGIILGAMLTISIWTGGSLFTLKHVLFLSLFAIPFSILLVYSIEKIGSWLGGNLSGWSSRKVMFRETLASDLQKAKYSKREGRFEEALNLIDEVLDKDPNFPDALYLKSHILWQGFENATAARGCLKKVLKMVPPEEPLHRWASSYYDEIIRSEKESSFIKKQEKSKLNVKKANL